MRQSTIRWREDLGIFYATVKGRYHSLGSDRKTAKARFGRLLAGYSDGSPNPTVCELIDKFIAWCGNADNCAASTLEIRLFPLNSFKQFIGSRKRVRDLKANDVTRWLTAKYKGKSGTYRNSVVKHVKRALNWAVDEELIQQSPIARFKPPRAGKHKTWIEPSQWLELLRLIDGKRFDDFRDFVTLIWETGARPNEVMQVEARFFEPANRRWVFPAAISKGRETERIVYLSNTAFAITQRLALRHPEGPIFRQRGKPWDKNMVRCKFKRLKQRLNLPKLRAYSLRHSFATRMLKAGVDSHIVMHLMGHTSTRMLERVYSHVNKDADFMLAALNGKSGGVLPEGLKIVGIDSDGSTAAANTNVAQTA